jgi:hypothetical protein
VRLKTHDGLPGLLFKFLAPQHIKIRGIDLVNGLIDYSVDFMLGGCVFGLCLLDLGKKGFALKQGLLCRNTVTGFVRIETEENSAILLLSIINMAHGLGLEVVAEGVELQAQADILAKFDCDTLQGYLFSKPLPENEATTLLKTGPVFPLAKNFEVA